MLLCTTEEWKEYALWTAGIDLAEQIGATNAWGMDRVVVTAQPGVFVEVRLIEEMGDPVPPQIAG